MQKKRCEVPFFKISNQRVLRWPQPLILIPLSSGCIMVYVNSRPHSRDCESTCMCVLSEVGQPCDVRGKRQQFGSFDSVWTFFCWVTHLFFMVSLSPLSWKKKTTTFLTLGVWKASHALKLWLCIVLVCLFLFSSFLHLCFITVWNRLWPYWVTAAVRRSRIQLEPFYLYCQNTAKFKK